MKRVLIVFSSIVFLISCGNSNDNNNAPTGQGTTAGTGQAGTSEASPQQAPPAADADVEKGLQLVATSDCLGCHKIDEKLTGPSYKEVAAKYENNDKVIDELAGKIIKGGAGNWGQVAMTPHPQLSQEDARAMVKYILSLK